MSSEGGSRKVHTAEESSDLAVIAMRGDGGGSESVAAGETFSATREFVEENSEGRGGSVSYTDDYDEGFVDDEYDEAAISASDEEPSLLHAALSSPDQVTAMLSNLSTSYNVVNISLALPILRSPSMYAGSVTEETDSICASSLLAGMVVGQLCGGALGDVMGRMKAVYCVIALQVIASLGSSILVWDGLGSSVFDQLAVWRFILGVGAGGVYPLAAVLSAEQVGSSASKVSYGGDTRRQMGRGDEGKHEDEMRRLKMVAITFSMQGVGFLCSPLVAYPVIMSLGNANLDVAWRIILGFGALPGLALVCLRWAERRKKQRRGEPVPLVPPEADASNGSSNEGNINAEEVFDNGGDLQIGGIDPCERKEPLVNDSRQDDEYGEDLAHDDANPRDSLFASISHEPYLARKLCGTAGTWFLFDVIFYGNTLFEPIVLEAAFGKSGSEGDRDDFMLLTEAVRDALALSAFALPGYFVSIYYLGQSSCCKLVRQTPRYIQIQGFVCMSLLYVSISIFWDRIRSLQWLLVLLYGGTFFFANYGPNTTTFMLPSVTYSPVCRSTLNGISAACGKAGALLGAAAFAPLAEGWGDQRVMALCGGISAIAALLTWAFVIQVGSHEEERRMRQDDEGHTAEERESLPEML